MYTSRWSFKRGLIGTLIFIASIIIFSFITMLLWNWLMPAIFGIKCISFMQSAGLMILCRLLIGWRSYPYHHFHNSKSTWNRMSPEEKKKFAQHMHARHESKNEMNTRYQETQKDKDGKSAE